MVYRVVATGMKRSLAATSLVSADSGGFPLTPWTPLLAGTRKGSYGACAHSCTNCRLTVRQHVWSFVLYRLNGTNWKVIRGGLWTVLG